MTTDTNRAEPMKGLAEWLEAEALDATPRNYEKLMRWATEVEASRLPPAGAAPSDEPKCPRCGLSQAECDFQKNFHDPEPFDASPALSDAAVQPVAWMHIQGGHEEVADRPLDAGEVARGWTEKPLYFASPLPTAPAGAWEAMVPRWKLQQEQTRTLNMKLDLMRVARGEATLCNFPEVEALRAALAAAPLDRIARWMSIETAPQDGSHILAFHPELGQRETYWHFYGDGSIAKADWIARKPGAQSGYWDWSEPQNHWGSSWKPTHWMPLPAPPIRKGE